MQIVAISRGDYHILSFVEYLESVKQRYLGSSPLTEGLTKRGYLAVYDDQHVRYHSITDNGRAACRDFERDPA